MARIRSLKPDFWIDEKLAPLDPIHRLVFIGLISQADDAGRIVDNVRLIDGLLFPETKHSSRHSLDTLAKLGRICRYTSASGQRLLQIVSWTRHQRVDKPGRRLLPGPSPEDLTACALTTFSRESRDTLEEEHGADMGSGKWDMGSGSEQPSSNPLYTEAFEALWSHYPRKKNKADAARAFSKKKCAKRLDHILAHIAASKLSRDWLKDDGAFIPYPASWINAGAYDDPMPKPWKDNGGVPSKAKQRQNTNIAALKAAREADDAHERRVRQGHGDDGRDAEWRSDAGEGPDLLECPEG